MRATRWVGLLAAALAFSAAAPSTAITVREAAPGAVVASAAGDRGPGAGAESNGTVDLGVQFHGTWSSYTDAERARALTRIADMGATWVRIDIGWTMMQPNRGRIDTSEWGVKLIDSVVSMAHARGLKVLGTLWLTPEWANPSAGERSAPRDPRTYGRALQWAAEHWKGKVQAWEVWNEPNSGDFLVGADPRTYTRLLCAGYRAVNADPGSRSVKVVFGGTMHNDVPWIERAYRAGAKGCYDVMATHPYQSPSDTGPGYGDGSEVWEFEHLGALRSLMRRHHDRSPVWVTELGWSAHRNRGNEPAWARGVTPRQQARYSVAALEMMEQRYPFVRKTFFYNERSVTGSGAHMAGYGIMDRNLRPRPVYDALRRWARG